MNEALFILKKGLTKFFHLENEYLISYESIEIHFGRVLDQIR